MEAQKEPEDESKLSDSALIKSINNGVFVIDQRIDDLEDKLVELENKLQKIFWFIEFHLGEIPQKYKKIYPKEDECPYFKANIKPYPHVHESRPGTLNCTAYDNLEMPKNPEDYLFAKDRMKAYSQEKYKITEEYFELWDEKRKLIKETLSIDEANEWVTQGPKQYRLYEKDDSYETILSKEEAEKWANLDEKRYYIDLDLRSFSRKFRRVFPKPASSEAFPTSSASQDSCQVDKPIESSPSSQESPDHKNPPSQT